MEPGDLICAECGEGNPTTRKFCSRCGTSLESAQVVKAKWWQKLMPRRGPKKRKAGDRPSARKTRKSFPSKVMAVLFGGVSRVVGVILLVGGLVYGIVPNVRSSVNEQFGSIKGTVNGWIHPKRTEVIPTGVIASSQLPGHAGQFITDGPTNTYWEARIPKKGTVKLTLDFTFQSKFDLKNLAVWNGVGSSKTPDYTSTARLQDIFLDFPGTNIPGCPVKVQDLPNKAVTINVSNCNASGVAEIRVTLLDFAGGPKLTTVAAAKLQFYKKG